MVGLGGLEPPTSRLSGVRSSRLSYKPGICQRIILWQPDGSLVVIPFKEFLLRKEVIQPHLPIRLPCYDFTPITGPTLGGCLLTVSPPTSGVTDSRGVTGGVYKARERIHRDVLTRDY